METGISPPRSEALLCLPGWETGLGTKQEGENQREKRDGENQQPQPGWGIRGGCTPGVPSIGGGERGVSGGDADACAAPRPNGENARDGR